VKTLLIFLLLFGIVKADWLNNVGNWTKKAYKETERFTVKASKDVAKFSVKAYKNTERFTVKASKDVAKFSVKAYKETEKFTVKTSKKVVKYVKAHPKEVAIGTVVTLLAVDIATGGTTLGLTAPVVTHSLAVLGGGSMVTGVATVGVAGATAGYLLGKDGNNTKPLAKNE